MNTYFHHQPDCPDTISATTAISRFVDALGFRYYWATETLTEKEIDFRPDAGSMSLYELLQHLYSMAASVNRMYGGHAELPEKPDTFEGLREGTLNFYQELSLRLKDMKDEVLEEFNLYGGSMPNRFSFWFTLNGQIADSLTHVGQITSWRRISGNPQLSGINVFLGKGL